MSFDLNLLKAPRELRELNLLQELEKNPVCSQRELSNKFGFALGVTNACLKKMVQRGWIRLKDIDHKRIGYFLTPKGLYEKAKLDHHLMSWSVQHYAVLREIIGQRLQEIEAQGAERVAFYGVSQEMEVAYLLIQGARMTLVGIVEDPERINDTKLFGLQLKDVNQIGTLRPDAVFVTSLSEQKERIEKVSALVDPQRVRIWGLSYAY
jgi:DNA-binding MarR family transcriptional regulator